MPGLAERAASPALVAENRPPPNLADLTFDHRYCKITKRSSFEDQDHTLQCDLTILSPPAGTAAALGLAASAVEAQLAEVGQVRRHGNMTATRAPSDPLRAHLYDIHT